MKNQIISPYTPLATGRRGFLKQISAAGLASCLPGMLGGSATAASTPAKNTPPATSKPPAKDKPPLDKIWGCMLHLSFNFALGINSARWTHPRMGQGLRTEFEPEQSVWDAAIKEMAAQKINMLLVNLDDSVLWRSHPEIALKNSWTPEKLHEELSKIRKLGIEPIPLLNFSTSHDAWMGKYSRMVSSQPYYKVCRDLIAEAIEIFDTPRFIHFGMDEEKYSMQEKRFDYIVVRQDEHWWGDLYFYCAEAMMRGVRPWVWSDCYWNNPKMFLKMMPKYVVQSNWYYREEFNPSKSIRTKTYLDLAAAGYDQIPTGSNDGVIYGKSNDKNIGKTVDFCAKHIPDGQLLGFMQSVWVPTIGKFQPNILDGIRLIGDSRKRFESKK